MSILSSIILHVKHLPCAVDPAVFAVREQEMHINLSVYVELTSCQMHILLGIRETFSSARLEGMR